MAAKPFFSIVIPAYNAEKTLEGCLDSIEKMDFPKHNMEIILVDDGSDDNTASIAKNHDVFVIQKKCRSLSEVRNIGAQQARGKILAFLDSDIIVDKLWLSTAYRYYTEQGFEGGIHFADTAPAHAEWTGRLWNNPARQGKQITTKKDYLVTRNLCMPKKIHELVGGFDEELFQGKRAGEDKEYTYRIHLAGNTLITDHSLYMLHMGYEKNLWTLIKKEWWHQGSTLFLARKYCNPFRLLRNPLLSLFHLLASLSMITCIASGSIIWITFGALLWMAPSLFITLAKMETQEFRKMPGMALLTFIRWNVAGYALVPQSLKIASEHVSADK